MLGITLSEHIELKEKKNPGITKPPFKEPLLKQEDVFN